MRRSAWLAALLLLAAAAITWFVATRDRRASDASDGIARSVTVAESPSPVLVGRTDETGAPAAEAGEAPSVPEIKDRPETRPIRVLDRSGNPIPQVEIELDWQEPGGILAFDMGSTDRDGRWEAPAAVAVTSVVLRGNDKYSMAVFGD